MHFSGSFAPLQFNILHTESEDSISLILRVCSIWALGCVIYEVCALKPAFHSFNCDGIIKKIKSGKVPAIPSEFSEPLRRLVRTMLYTDECKRPSAEDILAMPFLQVLSSTLNCRLAEIKVF